MLPENRPSEISLLRKVEPLFPRVIRNVPRDERNWLGEVELEGMRVLVHAHEGLVLIRKETGGIIARDVFPRLARGFEALAETQSFILDGKIIFGKGKTQEERAVVLDRAESESPAFITREELQFSFAASDILYSHEGDLRESPIEERKEILRNFISKNFQKDYGIYSLDYDNDPRSLKERAEKEGFEGVVYKKKGSRYKKVAGVAVPWAKLKF